MYIYVCIYVCICICLYKYGFPSIKSVGKPILVVYIYYVVLLYLLKILCKQFVFKRSFDGILVDYSRQRLTAETMKKLFHLAEVYPHFYPIHCKFSFIYLSELTLTTNAGCSP